MQRRHLVGILKLMFIVGGVLLMLPIIKSMGLINTSTSTKSGILVDTRQIQPGQYQTLEYAGREIWIYRWSKTDRQQQAVQDPQQAWSVLIPYEPHRGCRVQLQEHMNSRLRFMEPCFQAGFEVTGRRIPDTGVAEQKNLPRVPFQWQNANEIRLLLGKRVEQ